MNSRDPPEQFYDQAEQADYGGADAGWAFCLKLLFAAHGTSWVLMRIDPDKARIRIANIKIS
jgi:hypothetical protein